jgi:hypothetical protein
MQQLYLPFQERRERLRRRFKQAIVAVTVVAAVAMVAASSAGRYHARLLALRARDRVVRLVADVPRDRAEIDAEWALRRARGIRQTRENLSRFFDGTTEEMRELFRVAGMDPDHALIRYGRADPAFVISPQVFEPDDSGRSYHFRPNTRSVWLRQVTLRGGPFAMFQVLDTPAHRAAAARAGAIVDEGSVQNTNSWGVRGPEPDLSAKVRGIVLGDSFMQAMFNGDDDTPSLHLERYLEDAWKVPVSILNTGHIGYSPEQYFYTLKAYGDRFRPHFVVVSFCPNDFGEGFPVLRGEGDWYDEAGYWIDQIMVWCRSRQALCLMVVVPTHVQIEGSRRDGLYPGRISLLFRTDPPRYCYPIEEFLDENLKLRTQLKNQGEYRDRSLLYNREIDDDHLSPRGARLWARVVGRRLVGLLEYHWPGAGAPGEGPPDAKAPVSEAATPGRR